MSKNVAEVDKEQVKVSEEIAQTNEGWVDVSEE